ncbi:replication initiator [Phytoactinopolyspora mesophila]|uniref:replication initiator n=1 Tax=Phytoactinopolyspora mesophila TaxID=2650750 RepID=UPI0031B64F4D
MCRSKAHDRDHLGLGGRRVLVSRKWTGKTLTEHKADRAAIVRTVLEDAGIEMDDHGEFSATATRPDGAPRYHWSPVKPGDTDAPSYLRLIAHAITRRQAWREQYEQAKQRAGPPGPNLSATIPGAATAA